MLRRPPKPGKGVSVGESDADYFARRAVEEEQAAAGAGNEANAAVHRKLAGKFASLAEKAGKDELDGRGKPDS